ncbi:MAG: hypothetical protein ACRCUI_02020, partial [Polymorphobacter sp.]
RGPAMAGDDSSATRSKVLIMQHVYCLYNTLSIARELFGAARFPGIAQLHAFGRRHASQLSIGADNDSNRRLPAHG